MIADLKPYLEYKDSGQPWLGKVPEHWKTERAKWLFAKMARPVRAEDEVVTCFRDGTVTLRKNRRLRGYTEATVEHGYQGIRKGDLVIHGMDAFAGAIGVSDSDGKSTPVYNVCLPSEGVNAGYYAHLIRVMSQSQWILALAKGIRERSTDFRFETFGNQRVSLPPPDEQAAIVRFLEWANGQLEKAIRAKRKVVTLLNEQKQAIIQRLVTRGGIDTSVRLKPSGIPGLGDILEHWEKRRLKIIASNVTEQTSFMSEFEVYVALENVESWSGNVHPQWKQDEDLFTGQVKKFQKNDVLFGKLRPYLAKAFTALVNGVCVGEFFVLRTNSFFLNPKFLEHILHTNAVIAVINSSTFGAKMPRVDWQFMGNLLIPLPPISEQIDIIHKIERDTLPLHDAISRFEREIALLLEYRTRLVTDVVTGKLDVREAAAKLPNKIMPDLSDNDSVEALEDEPFEEEALV